MGRSESAFAVRRGALAGLLGYIWLHKFLEHVMSHKRKYSDCREMTAKKIDKNYSRNWGCS